MQAQQGELERHVASHQRRLYGFMRARVRDDAVAQDLVQGTWLEVAAHFHTYDVQKGTFWVFTRNWAKFVLWRYWEDVAQGRRPIESAQRRDDADEMPDLVDRAPDGAVPLEVRIQLAEALMELLSRAANCTRPPHEVLTFILTRLEWRPREIVEELSEVSLAELAAMLERDYTALVPLPKVHATLSPLQAKLSCKLREVMPDPRTREIYGGMLDCTAGQTKLRDYYRPDTVSEELVVRWWDSVKRSVFSEVWKAGRGPLFERLQERMTKTASAPVQPSLSSHAMAPGELSCGGRSLNSAPGRGRRS